MLRDQTFTKPLSVLIGPELFFESGQKMINHTAVRSFRRLNENPQYCYRAILLGFHQDYPTFPEFRAVYELISSHARIEELFYVDNSVSSIAQLRSIASLCIGVYAPSDILKVACMPFKHLFWKGPPLDFLEALDRAALTATADLQ